MRSHPPQTGTPRPERPFKLLLWAALASLIFGALDAGEVLEDALRTMRNSLHEQKASGDIVFVAVDDASLKEVGEWPWPRSTQAKLIDQATRLGAKKILVNVFYDNPTEPAEDAALAKAIQGSRRVVLPFTDRLGPHGGTARSEQPLKMFTYAANVANVNSFYNYQNAVWHLPYGGTLRNRISPSFSAEMAGVHTKQTGDFRLDYSIDVASIPKISAANLLDGRVARAAVHGKTIVIGLSAHNLGDLYWIPGRGRLARSYVHIIGAETLKSGMPMDLSWFAPLFVSLLSCGLTVVLQARFQLAVLSGGAAILLIVPLPLEHLRIFVDVVPALFFIAAVGARLGWLHWHRRGLTNSLSGLPNLEALRNQRHAGKQALIAARVHNFAEIASTLNDSEERELVRQMTERLSVAQPAQRIFQGDEGIFAWLVENDTAVANHLEALHSLFRSPVSAGGRAIDVAISFGAEMGSERSVTNRLGSALVAADEAWSEGLRWKLHDTARDEQVNWRLSLLSRLDAAIDSGEVWLAYQPQFDVQQQRIVGAEALARWTHPEKGPISPAEFVAAAEAHGRISKLTDFVLDRAISTAAAINRRGMPFNIAVNLSARLLGDRELVGRIQRMLTIHGLKPARLTLELTETAAITEADSSIGLLDCLKALGVRIAIDDYGTGLSTLEYLKKVPADEIKIDQSFIRSIRVNRSDMIMVQSTIALAHSLGRKVVAEGVEDQQVLEDLKRMNCDFVQGFVVGRPMGVRELIGGLALREERSVA